MVEPGEAVLAFTVDRLLAWHGTSVEMPLKGLDFAQAITGFFWLWLSATRSFSTYEPNEWVEVLPKKFDSCSRPLCSRAACGTSFAFGSTPNIGRCNVDLDIAALNIMFVSADKMRVASARKSYLD